MSAHQRDGAPPGAADSEFNRFADPSCPDRLSRQALNEDDAYLSDGLSEIRTRVNKLIAHADEQYTPGREGPPKDLPPLAFGDIREALARLGAIANHYLQLLCNRDVVEWTPVFQSDWQGAFRVPLFPVCPDAWDGADLQQGFT